MHLIETKIRNKNKTYRYVQLVRSYRRKSDGKKAHRVVGNLGDLPALTVKNLRIALKAARESRTVILAPDTPGLSDATKVQANLRYLDIAVMMEMWRSWGLGEILSQFIDDGESVISHAAIICALTLQRCVAPGSKLFAERWIPTTALPELLGSSPGLFNNTRIHRVLKSLHQCDKKLQQKLPELYEHRDGAFAMTFMDVTNTYFEGRECDLAERTCTKEGHHNKRAIGIVLLANQHGYPLRWKVVPGKTKDHLAMGAMVDQLHGVEWLGTVPIVMDRAMGREATISKLLRSGLRFLTAAPVNSIESHTLTLPHEVFSNLALGGTDNTYKTDIELATQAARNAGMEEVDEHLFVIDLGVEPFAPTDHKRTPSKTRCASLKERILLARALRAGLDAGEYKNQQECIESRGLTANRLSQLLRLLQLAPDIQERILGCPDDWALTAKLLEPVLKEPDHQKQREMLTGVLPDAPAGCATSTDQTSAKDEIPSAPSADRLRLLAYFNPQMHVDQRRRAQQHLDELHRFIEELNAELAQAKKSRDEESTRRKIIRELEKKDYVDAFDISLTPISVTTMGGSQITSSRCALTLKPEVWARRRQYDGFVLLLGHPDLPQSAVELALMYRAKDAVEKDFQTIKSVIKLRPVYHYTNPKVEAHVTNCILSLLLHRTLERRLRDAQIALSAPACLEILSTCHLNQMKPLAHGQSFYSVTAPTTAQQEILAALNLSHLVDDKAVGNTVTARFISTKKS
jgi:transposase